MKEDRYSLALEQAAGEKLFAIIVETDIICSMLIKTKSFMKQNAILIPNNKDLGGKKVSDETLEYV